MEDPRAGESCGGGDGSAAGVAAGCWAALCRRFPAADLHHDEVLVGIAGVVGDAHAEPVLARLDDLSRGLFGMASAPVEEQAAGLEALLSGTFGDASVDDDYRALLVDRALASRRTHPILLAACGHELARRAGLVSRVARSREGWWTALFGSDGCAVVGPADAEPPLDLHGVRLVCAHETAVAVLTRLRALAPPPRDRLAERMLVRLAEQAEGRAGGSA